MPRKPRQPTELDTNSHIAAYKTIFLSRLQMANYYCFYCCFCTQSVSLYSFLIQSAMTVAGGCLAALRFQITNQRLPISKCFLNNLVNRIIKKIHIYSVQLKCSIILSNWCIYGCKFSRIYDNHCGNDYIDFLIHTAFISVWWLASNKDKSDKNVYSRV